LVLIPAFAIRVPGPKTKLFKKLPYGLFDITFRAHLAWYNQATNKPMDITVSMSAFKALDFETFSSGLYAGFRGTTIVLRVLISKHFEFI